MFDYTFQLTNKTGKTVEISYSKLIGALGIADEIVHGRPLKAGGAPQALTVAQLVETQGYSVAVLYNGNEIF